jgi:hypothetical protein
MCDNEKESNHILAEEMFPFVLDRDFSTLPLTDTTATNLYCASSLPSPGCDATEASPVLSVNF